MAALMRRTPCPLVPDDIIYSRYYIFNYKTWTICSISRNIVITPMQVVVVAVVVCFNDASVPYGLYSVRN